MNITSTSDGSSSTSRLWLAVPLVLYCFYAFRDIGLPGLYMDAANPDYQAAWMMRGAHRIPAWTYPDNVLTRHFLSLPLLNSLYGGNPSAYVGRLFFSVFGFGLGEIRALHALMGLGLIAAWMHMLRAWKVAVLPCAVALSWLAVEPTFVLAWRTQYYLQLFPAIFFAIALAHLGCHFRKLQEGHPSRRHLLWAGALLGFAAYGYFIFALYAFAVVCIYAVSVRGMQAGRVFRPLCASAAIGWSPYLYAHLSILGSFGPAGYVKALRGLQGTYGVGNVAQGGWIDRPILVWQKLGQLVAGRGIELNIFGNASESGASVVVAATLLLVVAAAGLGITLRCLASASAKAADGGEPSPLPLPALLVRLLFGVLVVHLVFGLALAAPLQMQHYVMLLPVMAGLLAAGWTSIVAGMTAGAAKPARAVAVAAVGIAVAFNIAVCSSVFDRLRKEGGAALYSDAINVAAAFMEVQRVEGALLFPQWGYWMGIATIVGPRMSMYETPTLAQMAARLRQDPDLKKHRDFTLLLGQETEALSLEAIDATMAEFARTTGLDVTGRTVVRGRNGRDRLVLVSMKRSAP